MEGPPDKSVGGKGIGLLVSWFRLRWVLFSLKVLLFASNDPGRGSTC